jgi:hypothetical protein
MSKEMINPKSIRANTPDWQEGYEQGLLAGFTKSIVLIRHLQRTYNNMECEQQVLKEAMELIAQKIEPNNNDEFFSREDDAREI